MPWEPPPVEPLNDAVWQTWKAKGREDDLRRSSVFVMAVRFAAVTALLIVTGLGEELARQALLARLVVALSAAALMVLAIQSRQLPFAAAFGLIAAFYNPVPPAFDSGSWERVFVGASAIPFLTPLMPRKAKEPRNA
jgi:hypothetical protein